MCSVDRHKKDPLHLTLSSSPDTCNESKEIWNELSREFVDFIMDCKGYQYCTRKIQKLHQLGLPIGNRHHSKKSPSEYFLPILHTEVESTFNQSTDGQCDINIFSH